MSPGITELLNRTAVVTGSTTGIGRAIALALSTAGAAVLVHGHRSGQAAHEFAEQIRATGRESHVHLCDLADPASHAAFVETAWSWRGAVDIWVNNAGADVLCGEAAGWPFEQKLARLWAVDVQGTIGLSRLVGRRMRMRGQGVILNMGWDQAEQGMAGDSGEAFATIKGAIMAFSRSLARSLAPEVRVNCLAPGWIKTAWGDTASSTWQERAKNESLLHRWGSSTDVAEVARFLASDAASFVNGEVVRVNGGWRGSY